MAEEIKNDDSLTYDSKDIQRLLKMKRSKVYKFLAVVMENQKPFRVMKIGRDYRIPKESFDKWINGN